METNTHLIEFIPGAKAKASDVNFNFKNLNDAVNLSKQINKMAFSIRIRLSSITSAWKRNITVFAMTVKYLA